MRASTDVACEGRRFVSPRGCCDECRHGHDDEPEVDR